MATLWKKLHRYLHKYSEGYLLNNYYTNLAVAVLTWVYYSKQDLSHATLYDQHKKGIQNGQIDNHIMSMILQRKEMHVRTSTTCTSYYVRENICIFTYILHVPNGCTCCTIIVLEYMYVGNVIRVCVPPKSSM